MPINKNEVLVQLINQRTSKRLQPIQKRIQHTHRHTHRESETFVILRSVLCVLCSSFLVQSSRKNPDLRRTGCVLSVRLTCEAFAEHLPYQLQLSLKMQAACHGLQQVSAWVKGDGS